MHRAFLNELNSFDRSTLRPTGRVSKETFEHPRNLLLKDIERQFNKQENSDVTIVCDDGRKLYVSSFILQARSPHFERMFQSGMKESSTKEIKVNASYEAAQAMFKYFYCDRLETSPKIALEVMILADMYLLEYLKQLCMKFVKESVCINTALDFYEWSKDCQFEDLTNYVSKFIWKNFGYISKTPQFRGSLSSNPQLFIDLLNDLPENARFSNKLDSW
ncbi:unnamed protein product [Blepharisma stoltei]|uniref:BTB domain-containing protein n=1 Tax=Blepharisma stoltei TaxID=1481888 RepID=A0AAU9JJQ8_9CILI|nr:unnamed protein product [Blepharisma stoltei]